MVTTTSFVAACSILALSFAAPIRNNVATRAVTERGAYIMFGGDGTLATGWPSRKSWLSFDDAWYVWFIPRIYNLLMNIQGNKPQHHPELLPGRRLG